MTTLANVNIGSSANSGTGDPLRTAFQTINLNFANISASGGPIGGVISVAGRTGNVVLTVNDVTGAAAISYVNSLVSAANLASASYTMGNSNNWTSNVTTIAAALDQLSFRLKSHGL